MSSPTIETPPESGYSGKAVGIGLAFIAIAVIGYFVPLIGVPFGLNSAVALAIGISGLAFVVPSFVRFRCLQDYAGGVFLIVLAVIGVAGTASLNFKTSTGVGPGMMPRATGLIIIALGLIMIINALYQRGEGLDRWSIRGIVFVLGSAMVFGWTIRSMGLIVAGPLAVIISAMADRDTKWLEVIVFSILMTVACIGLFSYALKLPIPIWPTQTPYIPGYEAIKFNIF